MKPKSHRILSAFATLLPAAIFAMFPAHGINITVIPETPLDGAPEHPDDPGSAKLFFLAEKAAAYWEARFPNGLDPHNLTMRFSYAADLDPSGVSNISAQANGRPTVAEVRMNNTKLWFYDDDPYDHSEFDMVQTLVRDLTNSEYAAAFASGGVPEVLEVSYEGEARLDAPADARNNQDMYSLLLHEIGHNLGMSSDLNACDTELLDTDFDVDPSLVNSNQIQVLPRTDAGNAGAHTAAAGSLMRSGLGNGKRRLPSALDMLAIATCPDPGWSDLNPARQDFFPGGTDVWNTAANWVGASLPSSFNDVAVRHTTGVSRVVNLTGSGFCKDLLLTTRTGLRTGTNPLRSFGKATVLYDGLVPGVTPIPRLRVEANGSFRAVNLDVQGGEFFMDGGTATIDETLTVNAIVAGQQSKLFGTGALMVGTKLINHGRITSLGTLTFNSPAFGAWDLDGPDGGGEVFATGDLDFASGGLSDAFDGEMQIAPGHFLRIFSAWTLGGGGVIKLLGSVGNAAEMRGGAITANAGDITCNGDGLIDTPLILGGTVEVDVAAGGSLNLPKATTVSGGMFQVNNGSALNFTGTNTLNGGNFNGTGTVSLQGANTTVISTTAITCGIVKLDGLNNPAKKLILNSKLTVNAASIDHLDNSFDSTLEINNTAGNLTINGPTAWAMNGTLHHDSGTALLFPSISGAPFSMNGTTEVTAGTRWDARVTITGTVLLSAVGDKLGLGGGTALNPNRIQGGAVTGDGTLRAFNSHLSGYGSISAKILFETGSSLLADGGSLVLSGGFTEVPPLLGTADGDGTLDVVSPWLLPSTSVLDLTGGIVQGGAIANEGAISGYGEIRSNNVTNNGNIAAADNQTLVINTSLAPDLDGTGTDQQVAGHTLNAIDGNLEISKTPLDPIGATLTIAPGRSMSFLAGWTLEVSGTLNATGNTSASPALLAGSSSTFRGSLNLDDHVRCTTSSSFDGGSVTTLADAGTVLRLEANASIAKGAVFSGPGRLEIGGGKTLTLANGATIGVAVTNDQSRLGIGASPGQATVASYAQTSQASMVVEISGGPATSDWDQLTVSGHAELGGRLEVVFDAFAAVACDTWKILSADSVSGNFSEFSVVGVPAGHQVRKFETSTGVYLTLSRESTFSDWAMEQGLLPGNDEVDDDPDADMIVNALEMLMGSDPEVPEFGLLPGADVTTLNGIDYLSITLPLHVGITPTDLILDAAWSTDLENWSAGDIESGSDGFNEIQCLDKRLFRSKIPFGTLPAEFLRIQITEVGP